MLDYARTNGHLVPLDGYQVFVHGASPLGMSPEMWNSLKEFWSLYFEAAGAELRIYSAETIVNRRNER